MTFAAFFSALTPLSFFLARLSLAVAFFPVWSFASAGSGVGSSTSPASVYPRGRSFASGHSLLRWLSPGHGAVFAALALQSNHLSLVLAAATPGGPSEPSGVPWKKMVLAIVLGCATLYTIHRCANFTSPAKADLNPGREELPTTLSPPQGSSPRELGSFVDQHLLGGNFELPVRMDRKLTEIFLRKVTPRNSGEVYQMACGDRMYPTPDGYLSYGVELQRHASGFGVEVRTGMLFMSSEQKVTFLAGGRPSVMLTNILGLANLVPWGYVVGLAALASSLALAYHNFCELAHFQGWSRDHEWRQSDLAAEVARDFVVRRELLAEEGLPPRPTGLVEELLEEARVLLAEEGLSAEGAAEAVAIRNFSVTDEQQLLLAREDLAETYGFQWVSDDDLRAYLRAQAEGGSPERRAWIRNYMAHKIR